MKVNKAKNKIIISLSVIVFLYFSYFGIAFASEINKENIIYLVNQSRKENNSEILKENQKLDQAAEDKANDMIKNNYFAHTSPAGVTPWDWFDKNAYDYKYAGENLALGFTTVENEHKAWMDSPTHKKNILNPNYKEIGVAVEKGIINNKSVIITVQMFGTLREGVEDVKENNNIPSNDSGKGMENKKQNKGIVLNTENSGPSAGNNYPGKGGPILDFSIFKQFISENKGFLSNPIFTTSVATLALCIVFNLLVALVIIFHNLIKHLRTNKDMFTVVHSILIIILVSAIVF